MGVFSRLFSLSEKRSNDISDPRFWINDAVSAATSSGAYVSVDTAMKTSTVFGCVRILSETIASLPVSIYKTRKDGGEDVARDHYLYPILHDAPNDEQTSYEFREGKQAHLALRGNGYTYKIINEAGQTIKLIAMSPARMEPKRDWITGKLIYSYTRSKEDSPDIPDKPFFTPNEIWHVKGLSTNGIIGLSPLSCARESIGMAIKSEEFGAQYFANAAVVSGVLEHPASLKDEAWKRLKSSIQDFASSKRHQTMILEEGMKWQAIGLSNKDSQFLESRAFQVEDIARFFNVPLILLQHSDKASTYASAEQLGLNFVMYTILPWVKRWEQSANFSLLTLWERKKGFHISFNLEGLLRGDTAARYQSYAVGRQWGWLSANDIRALENMNPIDGGDEYITMPQNIAGKPNPEGEPKEQIKKEPDEGDEGGTDDEES